ncbi:hypothetical protein [Myroides sp. LJL119]
MAVFTVNRPSNFVYGYRKYRIKIDGKTVGSISDGQTKEFTLPKGVFKVTAHIDWCSSNPIYIDTNQQELTHMVVKPFILALWIVPVIVACVLVSLLGVFVLKKSFFLLLLIPAILYLVYLFSLGRKKFLILEQN